MDPKPSFSFMAAIACVVSVLCWCPIAAADPIPATEEATQLEWAAEQAAAARQEQRQFDLQRLAKLQEEIEQLAHQLGSDHPRLQQLQKKLRDVRAAHEQRRTAQESGAWQHQTPAANWSPGVEQSLRGDRQFRQAAAEETRRQERSRDEEQARANDHVRQAIEHLHAAGMGDLAERVRGEIERRNRPGRRDRHPGAEMPWGRRESAPRRGADLEQMVHRLAETVGHLEQRVRESEEIRLAVHEIQQHLGNVQKRVDERLRLIESHIDRQARDAETMIGERSEQVEEAVEMIEQYVHEAVEALEERLDDLNEE